MSTKVSGKDTVSAAHRRRAGAIPERRAPLPRHGETVIRAKDVRVQSMHRINSDWHACPTRSARNPCLGHLLPKMPKSGQRIATRTARRCVALHARRWPSRKRVLTEGSANRFRERTGLESGNPQITGELGASRFLVRLDERTERPATHRAFDATRGAPMRKIITGSTAVGRVSAG